MSETEQGVLPDQPYSRTPKRNKKGWLTQNSLKWGYAEEFKVGNYTITLGRQQGTNGQFYTVAVERNRWGALQNRDYGLSRKYLGARHRFEFLKEKYARKVAVETLEIET